MAKDYEINEADIDRMILYIKTIDPDHATPEMAILMIETEYAKNHLLSHENPEAHYAIYQDLKKKKKLI